QGRAIDNIFWGVKNYVEGGAYVGLLPLLLVVIAFAAWVRGLRHARPEEAHSGPPLGFFFLLGFFALSFAFPTRLYALRSRLPGTTELHSRFRWVWPLSLCVPVLSGTGLEALRDSTMLASRRHWPLPTLWRAMCLWAEPSLATALGGLAVWLGLL